MNQKHSADAWEALINAFGGVEKAAQGLGICTRTLHRWRHGVVPRLRMVRMAVNQISRGLHIEPVPFPGDEDEENA